MNNLPTPVNETARVSATQAVRVEIPHMDTPHYHMPILSRLINQAHKEFLAGLSEHSITCLGKRPERALKIALDGRVAVTEEPDKFVVRSCSDPDVWYTVDLSKRIEWLTNYVKSTFMTNRDKEIYHGSQSSPQVR